MRKMISWMELVIMLNSSKLDLGKMGVLVALGGAVAMSGCSYPKNPPPVDLRAMQRPERESAREVQPPERRALPTTLESPYLARPGAATRPAGPPPTTGPALEN